MRVFRIILVIFAFGILLFGFEQDAFAAFTGSVSLDRTVYPVPWGELADIGGIAFQGGTYPIYKLHNTAITEVADTDQETLGNGDLTIHVRINDPDFNLNNSLTDTIEQNVSGTSVGPLKIMVQRDGNTMVLAYAGGNTINTSGKIDVNDNYEKVVTIRQLGAISEITPESGIFELDFVIRYTDGPADFQCPTTASFVGTSGIRSADEFERFDESSGSNDFCILRGDTILVEYTDPSDVSNSQNIVKDTATFDMRKSVLQTDKAQYYSGDDMILTLIDADFDLDNDVREIYDLDLIEWSSVSATITMGDLGNNIAAFDPQPAAFRETGDSTGIFQTVVKIPSELSGKNIGSETVTLEMTDWSSVANEYVGDETWDTQLTININPGIIRTGKLVELQGQTIPIVNHDSGVIKLPQNVDVYFPLSNHIREKIKAANLETQPSFNDKFVEHEKKIVLKKSTEVTISSNAEFVSIFGQDSKTVDGIPIKKNDQIIGYIDDNFVNNKIKSFIDNCTENDPKAYCYMSQEELKNDIVNKLGVHTIHEEFVVYKEVDIKSAHLRISINEFFEEDIINSDYDVASIFPNYDISNSILPTVDAQQTRATLNGNSKSDFKFLNGFTLGHGYSLGLERNWEYKDIIVFDSKVTAFVGLGIGLRIPGEATITAPTQNHEEFAFSVNLFEANPAQYTERGVPSSQIFSGDEFVLELGPEIEANVKFLGIQLSDFSLQEKLFGTTLPSGSNFDPPLGVNDGREEFFSEELPCNLNRYLCQEYGFVSASVNPGLKTAISGNELTINLTHTPSGKSKLLHFSSEDNTIYKSTDSTQNLSVYEIKLDNVTYDSEIIVTPFLHAKLDLGMFDWLPFIGKGFDETVNLFDIEFEHIMLERHDDTRGVHTINIQDNRAGGTNNDCSSASEISVDGECISYTITNGSVESITPDVDANSLIISVDVTDDGLLTLTIPRVVLDATINGEDDDFFVLINAEEVDFDEDATSTHRKFTIVFPRDANEIEIIGTFVIPEFGAMTSIVLMIAMVTIISVLSTKKQFPSLKTVYLDI